MHQQKYHWTLDIEMAVLTHKLYPCTYWKSPVAVPTLWRMKDVYGYKKLGIIRDYL